MPRINTDFFYPCHPRNPWLKNLRSLRAISAIAVRSTRKAERTRAFFRVLRVLRGFHFLPLVLAAPDEGLHPLLLPRRVSKKRWRVCAKPSAVLKRRVLTPARRKARSNSASRWALVAAYFWRTAARLESTSSNSPVSASSIVRRPAGGSSASRGLCRWRQTRSWRALVRPSSWTVSRPAAAAAPRLWRKSVSRKTIERRCRT